MKPGTPIRYIANGIFATLFHYVILNFCLNIINIESAGVSSIYASFFGVISSFLGNKYFVFKDYSNQLLGQSLRFIFLYTVFGSLHSTTLYFWSDVLGKNYHYGFLIATFGQFSLGYFLSQKLIFDKAI